MGTAVDRVDPTIGVDGGGNCLIGPYLPLGLVRLGPDTLPPHTTSGYQSHRPIVRFSHTHVSGTGGSGRYGNVGVTPFAGPPRFRPDAYDREGETATAGCYRVRLLPAGIEAELTATPRVGVHRYTFPAGAQANLLFDAGAVVQTRHPSVEFGGTGAISTGGFVEFVSERELVGRGDFRGGWGHTFPYSVHFYARFDRPARTRWPGNAHGGVEGAFAEGSGSCAVAGFGEARRVELRVGVSFVSVAQARASVDREAGAATFEELRTRARDAWAACLDRVRVEGGTDAERTLLATLMTRLYCMPTDLGTDDEFPLWRGGVRHFSEYYCLWDSVRNANSLLGLIDPDLEIAMLNCLLDVADHTGWLPDAWIAGHSAMIQGGSSADILLGEAAAKGFAGIDYAKALRQMRRNNEMESPDPYLHGRHLRDYRDLGFLSTNVRKNCVSRHLEYAYQDWCIGDLAARLGEAEVAARYREGSRKLWNLWREDLRHFAPRHPDGRWVEPFDPGRCLPDSWNDPYFYEGTSRQWSFSAHHDFAGLVARHGGPEGFVAHLDRFFADGQYHSKETMLHVPWLYHYAGRPDLSAARVRWAMGKFFRVARNGLSDNEDMGCQSAFFICSALGFYPLMGQDLYWLAAPVFERAELALGGAGRTLRIEAPGAGAERPYIAAATLDGRPLGRAWLRHAEVAGGATLRYELSATPTAWAQGIPPPSPMAG